jgi:hypothetical protein
LAMARSYAKARLFLQTFSYHARLDWHSSLAASGFVFIFSKYIIHRDIHLL